MHVETKFLRLFGAVELGDDIDGWRVCWLGGWDKCRVLFVVMVKRVTDIPGSPTPAVPLTPHVTPAEPPLKSKASPGSEVAIAATKTGCPAEPHPPHMKKANHSLPLYTGPWQSEGREP